MNGLRRGVHIYNGNLLSHKKYKLMPFAATWMELRTLILSEVNQKEKDKYCMISLICGIWNMEQMILSKNNKQVKNRNRSWPRRTDLRSPGVRGWNGIYRHFGGFFGCKLLYFEWMGTAECVWLGHFVVQPNLIKRLNNNKRGKKAYGPAEW